MGKVYAKHPTIEECKALWNKYETPLHIRKHCMAVAMVAHAIGTELVRNGADLDLDLIMAAGMCHDVVRLIDRHDLEGARVMREHGYNQEADIIQVHMLYGKFSPLKFVTETDLVCLGDRTVKENTYVGIEERYEYIINKAIRNGHPDAAPFIKEKMADAVRFTDEIKAMTGKTIDEIARGIVAEW